MSSLPLCSLLPTPHSSQGAQESAKIPPAQRGPCDLASHPKGSSGIPRNAGDILAAHCCQCQPLASNKHLPKMARVPSEAEEGKREGALLGSVGWDTPGKPQTASCGWWNLSQSVWEAERAGG